MSYKDEIVNEVRKSREKILKKFNGNLENYFEFIRKEEKKNSKKLTNTVSNVIPDKKSAL